MAEYDLCRTCTHRSEEGFPLCDHYALADAENAEVDARDEHTTDESVALGVEIQTWRDNAGGCYDPGMCPGHEADTSDTVRQTVLAQPGLEHVKVATDVELLRTALVAHGRLSAESAPLRAHVGELLGHGSGVSTAICRALGLDPEAKLGGEHPTPPWLTRAGCDHHEAPLVAPLPDCPTCKGSGVLDTDVPCCCTCSSCRSLYMEDASA